MRRPTVARPSPPRTLIHPGRSDPVRIRSLRSPAGRHVRLELQPGRSLFDGLVEPLARMGIGSASTTILGGGFDAFRYCVAMRDPAGRTVATYGEPIEAGRTFLVFGNATLGRSMTGSPLVHCHAAIRTERGAVRGGHVLTEACIVGDRPIPVLVTSLDGFELRQIDDPETGMPLLQPFETPADE